MTQSPNHRIGTLLATLILCNQLWPQVNRTPSQPAEPGPTFVVEDAQLGTPLRFIAYGDTRFTDPANTSLTNPKIRQWLVRQLAKEAPDALVISGDIPLTGSAKDDYAVFKAETSSWRDLPLRVYPALGNHEMRGDESACLENWWDTFPELRGRRWYSTQLGSRVYIVTLDSNSSLLPGSEQGRWLNAQLESLAASIDFVFLNLHHPPVADEQETLNGGHNVRPNEVAVQKMLSKRAPDAQARFIVIAGHIHNYERRVEDTVVYLVSGGGGAKPVPVKRTPGDLYTSELFPNFHYLKFTLEQKRLRATMFRVDPDSDKPRFKAEDTFEISVKARARP